MNGPQTVLIECVDGLLKGRLALQDPASPWTASHPDLTSFPVNIKIVVLQPRVSEDHLVPAKIGYLGYHLFSVTLEVNDCFGIVGDVTGVTVFLSSCLSLYIYYAYIS